MSKRGALGSGSGPAAVSNRLAPFTCACALSDARMSLLSSLNTESSPRFSSAVGSTAEKNLERYDGSDVTTLDVVTGGVEGSVGTDPRAERRKVAGSTLSLALRVSFGWH